MALSATTSLKIIRKCLFNSAKLRNYTKMADPVEHATGLEKREFLARIAGCDDPYAMEPRKRGPGTKDKPNLVPSAFNERIVGCICEWNSQSVNYMWLFKGEPRRCECGHWFKLIHQAPV